MPLQNFVDNNLPTIKAAWLNAVDAFYFTLFNSATTAAQARTALGVGTIATQDASAVAITGGTITGITDLAVADGGTGASTAAAAAITLGYNYPDMCDFRLTLTSGTPVTTSDVTAAGTLYCAPYKGNRISLYDGSNWNIRSSVEFSLALTLTSGKPYDVFCYDNAGVATLEVLVWTNDTTRATALTTQNGVLVKTSAVTRRYLGTLYSSGANITEDSVAKRYLWNYYNRVNRAMRVVEATNEWNYTTAAYQQANASATNQLDYVQGMSEDAVLAEVNGTFRNTNVVNIISVGVGVDSTTANSAQIMTGTQVQVVNIRTATYAKYVGYPGVGRHKLVWLEYSTATGTTTWTGDDGSVIVQNGITGIILA